MPRRTACVCFFVILFLFSSALSWAENPSGSTTQKTGATSTSQTKSDFSEAEPVVTNHTIRIAGEVIDYTATAGFLTIEDESGKPRAEIFFIAYVRKGTEKETRPLTFGFNGGPGASSVWLNLGGVGPHRVQIADLKPSPPPYRLADNSQSWIPFTDLVFIDPVGTGFSRPASGVSAKDFYGIKKDVQSVAEFIRLYTSKYQRWLSPKFLVGESYGGVRAVELTDKLHRTYGMDLNGIILLSPALDFQTFSFQPANDLPYYLFLPTYTATAFYHKKLSAELQKDFHKTLKEVEKWETAEYVRALTEGDAFDAQKESEIAERLARYTGLSEEFVRRNDLRIQRNDFLTDLLKKEHSLVGLMDGRAVGHDSDVSFFNDPGMLVVIGCYVACMNEYIRSQLKYETNQPYVYLSDEANAQWNYGSASKGYVNVVESLREAVAARGLKVFVGCGYFDLDVPYRAAEYVMAHLALPGNLKSNITIRSYEAGHMLYVSDSSLKMLTSDVSGFIGSAVPGR